MTDTEMLGNLIKNKGFKLRFIADKIGISTQAFLNKRTNVTEFVPTEIEKICQILGISEELELKNKIFFAPNVEESSTKMREKLNRKEN